MKKIIQVSSLLICLAGLIACDKKEQNVNPSTKTNTVANSECTVPAGAHFFIGTIDDVKKCVVEDRLYKGPGYGYSGGSEGVKYTATMSHIDKKTFNTLFGFTIEKGRFTGEEPDFAANFKTGKFGFSEDALAGYALLIERMEDGVSKYYSTKTSALSANNYIEITSVVDSGSGYVTVEGKINTILYEAFEIESDKEMTLKDCSFKLYFVP